MNKRFLTFILIGSCPALFPGCTTTRTLSDVADPTIDFPEPTPSRKVEPGESFGIESSGGEESNRSWKSAVKIEVSVIEVGKEKAALSKRDLELEMADMETFLETHPSAELLSKPAVVTFPGRVATIESVVQIPVSNYDPLAGFPSSVAMIPAGFMASVLASAHPGVDSQTPISRAQEHDIPLRVVAAINEEEDRPEREENYVPTVRQYRIDRNLTLKPGVITEAGRITREETEYVQDKIPILADLPLIGHLPLFRRKVDLHLRKTTIITVRADWVEPREIYYQDVYSHTRTACPPRAAAD